jgi:pantothenate kinase type III
MILLFDIGNTHTHVGLADDRRVLKQINVPTREWFGGNAKARVKKFAGKNKIAGAVLCSVVPRATPLDPQNCGRTLETGNFGVVAKNFMRRGN